MSNKSKIYDEKNHLHKNREILLKLNNDLLKLTNIIQQIDSKQKLIQSDLESIKSYINKQETINKLRKKELEEELIKAEISNKNGWWFGY